MRQRLLKYLKRFAIVLLLLGLVGLGVFTWLSHWPFEGDVDDILSLVPEDVEFVLRADIEDLRSTGWVQSNVIDDPLLAPMGEAAAEALERIDLELATIQAQVAQQSPVDVDVRAFVEDNVLAGEVCIAGNFWKQASPRDGGPRWKDLLILKRVSHLARSVSGLQHGFIREQVQLGPAVELSAEGEGIFKFTLVEMQRTTPAARPGDPDMTAWYLARIKGVLAISNNRRLVEEAVVLGDDPEGRSFARRPGFEIPQTPGRVNAAINLDPLHHYFNRAFDYYPQLKPLRRFLPPDALVKLSGRLSLRGRDLLTGGGNIEYVTTEREAEDVVRNVYSLPDREVSAGIAALVPAKDTFAVISLRTNPEYLLNSVVKEALSPSDLRLWEDNLRNNPKSGFGSLEEFFEDLSTRIGNEAMVALARMGETYDQIDFPDWFSSEPSPLPAMAIMVKMAEGASQAELTEYLQSKIFLLGLEENLEQVKYGDYSYSRGKLKVETLDFKYIRPCFIVVSNHLVMTTTEYYMRQILDTVRDAETNALVQDETFRVTMAAVPERGHVGLFLDLEKLTRVPTSIRLEGDDLDLGAPGTRGLLWDGRNDWVFNEKDDRTEAIRVRAEIARRFPSPPNNQQKIEMEKLEDAHMERWLERYPEFIEEYRRKLEGWRRFRGVGVVLGATGNTINADFAVVLRERDRDR